MLTSSGRGGGRSILTVADRGEGGKICQNLADVICERSQRTFIYINSVLLNNYKSHTKFDNFNRFCITLSNFRACRTTVRGPLNSSK